MVFSLSGHASTNPQIIFSLIGDSGLFPLVMTAGSQDPDAHNLARVSLGVTPSVVRIQKKSPIAQGFFFLFSLFFFLVIGYRLFINA